MTGVTFDMTMGRGLPASVKRFHVMAGGAKMRMGSVFDRTNRENENKSYNGQNNNSFFLLLIHSFWSTSFSGISQRHYSSVGALFIKPTL
jgi:hypothetical protein